MGPSTTRTPESATPSKIHHLVSLDSARNSSEGRFLGATMSASLPPTALGLRMYLLGNRAGEEQRREDVEGDLKARPWTAAYRHITEGSNFAYANPRAGCNDILY